MSGADRRECDAVDAFRWDSTFETGLGALDRQHLHLVDLINALGTRIIDADGFKAVNDEHGHEAGDAVLQALAARIRESVRGEDDVCRLGAPGLRAAGAVTCPGSLTPPESGR